MKPWSFSWLMSVTRTTKALLRGRRGRRGAGAARALELLPPLPPQPLIARTRRGKACEYASSHGVESTDPRGLAPYSSTCDSLPLSSPASGRATASTAARSGRSSSAPGGRAPRPRRRLHPRQRDRRAIAITRRARRRRAAVAGAEIVVVPRVNPDGCARGTRGERARRRPEPELPVELVARSAARRPAVLRAAAAVGAGVALRRSRSCKALRPEITIWFHQPQGVVRAWGPSVATARRFARARRGIRTARSRGRTAPPRTGRTTASPGPRRSSSSCRPARSGGARRSSGGRRAVRRLAREGVSR